MYVTVANSKNIKSMMNKLKVVDQFYNLEVGDILILSDDKNFYEYNVSEGSSDKDSKFTFNASFKINSDYAKELIKQGYLEEVVEKQSNPEFKNIFTEIDTLLSTYYSELDSLDVEFANKPTCLKVEKNTVLNNLIKVLEHLKDLKK